MLRTASQASTRMGVDCIKWLAMLMLVHATIVHAQTSSELNDEFLEYLGNMESSEDNWTDFSATQTRDNAATTTRNSPPNSSDAHSSSSTTSTSSKATDGKHNSGPTNTTELKASK